jgi:hypothetical protein
MPIGDMFWSRPNIYTNQAHNLGRLTIPTSRLVITFCEDALTQSGFLQLVYELQVAAFA